MIKLFNLVQYDKKDINQVKIQVKVMLPKTEQLKTMWNAFANKYNLIDSSTQTFYYTLVNMLDLPYAKHILQIGCGTGKLLTYAINAKAISTTYLATDLSEKMIQVAHQNLQSYLDKMGVKETLKEWTKRHNLTLRAASGDQVVEAEFKFDRIIANLVLMLAQDPVKMMKNLYAMAQEGCLLGITVIGNPQAANLTTIMPEALKAKGVPIPNMRSAFHLYNKVQQLASQSGWDVVVQWQQNAPLSHLQIDQGLRQFINFMSRGDEFINNFHFERVRQIFSSKKILNSPVQMAILRKK